MTILQGLRHLAAIDRAIGARALDGRGGLMRLARVRGRLVRWLRARGVEPVVLTVAR